MGNGGWKRGREGDKKHFFGKVFSFLGGGESAQIERYANRRNKEVNVPQRSSALFSENAAECTNKKGKQKGEQKGEIRLNN